jgi:hypothetical protein
VTQTAPTTPEELRGVVDRARKGDRTSLPAVQEVLKHQAMVDLLGGNLARGAQLVLIRKLSGKDLLLQEALIHKMDSLRAELSGPNPAPLERLLLRPADPRSGTSNSRASSGWRRCG